MTEGGEHGLETYTSLSRTGFSPLFGPISYDFDSFASNIEELNLPYSFETPDLVTPVQEFENLSPASPDDGQSRLSFLPTPCSSTVRDSHGNDIWVSVEAQLNGNFFFADVEGTAGNPTQLTCYRRNIFGVSGSIKLPQAPDTILDSNGKEVAISKAEVCVSAFESTHRKLTEIVHVPIRTIGSDIQVSEDKTVVIPLSSETSSPKYNKMSSTVTDFPFEWKRLQFRKATANNGGRRGVQQQFRIIISVEVTLETGSTTSIAAVESQKIIVRGRNPGNFIQEHAPVAASNFGRQQSRSPKQIREVKRRSIPAPEASLNHHASSLPNSANFDLGMDNFPGNNTSLGLNMNEPSGWLGTDFEEVKAQYTNKSYKPYQTGLHTSSHSPSYSYSGSYPEASFHIPHPPHLSFSKHPPERSSTVELQYIPTRADDNPLPHKGHQRSNSHPTPHVGSVPDVNIAESAEPLYEYFPLGLDGWMPPVDPVYRPHIAHNDVLVPELRGLMIK